jgi:hypothetical protein
MAMQRQAHAVKEIIPAERDLGETLGNEVPTPDSNTRIVYQNRERLGRIEFVQREP